MEQETKTIPRDAWHWVEVNTAKLAVWSTLALMLIMLIEVAMRNVFKSALPGSFELGQLLIVAMVFLPMGLLQSSNSHVRMMVITDRLSYRVNAGIGVLINLLALAAFVILLWRSSLVFWQAVVFGEYSIGLVAFPLWPIKLMPPLGFFILCVRLIIQIVGYVRAVATPAPAATT